MYVRTLGIKTPRVLFFILAGRRVAYILYFLFHGFFLIVLSVHGQIHFRSLLGRQVRLGPLNTHDSILKNGSFSECQD